MTMAQTATKEHAVRQYLGKAVSKAIETELLAVAHYRRLSDIAPSITLRTRALADAQEEARHAHGLARAAQRDALEHVEPTTWGPELEGLHAAFEACASDGDIAACLFVQDVLLEAAAINLYEALARTAARADAFALAALLDKVIVPDERMHLADGLREICRLAPDGATRRAAFERATMRLFPAMRLFADPPREAGCSETCGSCRDRCLKLDACAADEPVGTGWDTYVQTITAAARSIGLFDAA
jgi:1,2-phenylacetyl-CoA epoxidase catalytic subunit